VTESLHCYFDRRGFWHRCSDDAMEMHGGCPDCKYEHRIAKTFPCTCLWCGENFAHRQPRAFCKRSDYLAYLSFMLSRDNEAMYEGGLGLIGEHGPFTPDSALEFWESMGNWDRVWPQPPILMRWKKEETRA